jgi:hypothetical protein
MDQPILWRAAVNGDRLVLVGSYGITRDEIITGFLLVVECTVHTFFLTRVRNGIHCCMFTLCLILFCNTILIRDERHLGVG